MDYTKFLLDHHPTDREATILVDADQPSRSITWETYASAIRRVAGGLQKSGVSDGHCVALWSKNNVYYQVLGDGVVAAGAIFTGLPSFTQTNELTKLLAASEASWLFAEPDLLESALLAAQDVGIPISHVMVFDPPGTPAYTGPQTTFSHLLKTEETAWKRRQSVEIPENRTCFRLFTSGTTGAPKAANVSHAAQIARIQSPQPTCPGSQADVRWLHVVGMYHPTSLTACNSAVVGSHTAYITGSLEAESILDNIQRHSITCTLLPPHIMEAMSTTIRRGYRPRDSLKSLRKVLVVGSVAPPESLERFKDLLPQSASLQTPYGCTEMGCTANVPDDFPTVHGHIGIAAPGVEIQIVDYDTWKVLDADVPGEICIRGAPLFSGYLNNPEATKASMLKDPTGNWFRTGDKGYFSLKHQQIRIVGRYKEIFKVKYEEVSPSELEAEFLKHPAILDVAVSSTIAREDEMDCECVAYVVAEDGRMDAYDVLRFAAERVSKHKIPTGGVLFCDEIPRNKTGKILRRELGNVAVQKDRSAWYLEIEKEDELGKHVQTKL